MLTYIPSQRLSTALKTLFLTAHSESSNSYTAQGLVTPLPSPAIHGVVEEN